MTPQRYSQVKQVYLAVRELTPDARSSFLDSACRNDAELRSQVERILASSESDAGFLETPAVPRDALTGGNHVANDDFERWNGRQLGAYRIQRLIGSGGMGAVFVGERADAEFQKRVAIKLIRPAIVTGDMVRRFRTERQVLAQLEHPNIARLLDSGTTDEGVPYLVMEYIEGAPIDRYCDEKRLPIAGRLALFRKVCAGVQHAHQHLVVHRDLKPGNILITPDGEPKLLDFGIAKMLDETGYAARLETTVPAMRLLTPRYASPEQIRGERVSTATDVYSLGVILYELLTGTSPYPETAASVHAMEQVICNHEPTRPSTAIGRTSSGDAESPAAMRMTDVRRLRRKLAGDLDNIVLKALRKEPHRRYESVSQLSDDVLRYLEGRPVTARRDSIGYRLSKFVRRNAIASAAAALLVVGLATASIVSTRLYLQADAARQAAQDAEDEARTQREISDQINAFLTEMLGSVSPLKAKGRDPGMLLDLLHHAAQRVKREFSNRPVVAASLQMVIGDTYRRLGKYDDALPHLQSAYDLRLRELGSGHVDTIKAADFLGMLRYDRGEHEAAEQLLRAALQARRKTLGNNHVDTLHSINNLGELLQDRGDLPAAATLFEEAAEGRRRVQGAEHRDTLITLNNLAGAKIKMGKLEEGEKLLREVLPLQRRLLGEEHVDTFISMNDLAYVLRARRQFEEAELLYRQALAGMRRVLGETHMDTLMTAFGYASTLGDLGRLEQAEAAFGELSELGDAHLPAESYLRAVFRAGHATAMSRLGRFEQAEPILLAALAELRSRLGDGHPYTRRLMTNAAQFYEQWGKPEKAAEFRPKPASATATPPAP